MFGFGSTELLIILVLVLVVFGAGKLPAVGRALGQTVRAFRQGTHEPRTIEIKPEHDAAAPTSPARSPDPSP